MTEAAFERLGPAVPDSPVVISVPHAGRDYPASLRTMLAVPVTMLTGLEDRHLDSVARLARGNCSMLVQHLPRAWIDLNRGENERDPRIDAGAPSVRQAEQSAKLRSGLGLVPRRVGQISDIWRRRLSDKEVCERIDGAHRPYHAALSLLLNAARDRWGVAILLDLHSMPSLGTKAAKIVLGDRYGHAAHPRYVERADAEAARSGLKTALNVPYAGGHILQRHGNPMAGIHAIQLELDRSLYLDQRLDQPGPGLERTATLVSDIVAALADEALATALPIAAE